MIVVSTCTGVTVRKRETERERERVAIVYIKVSRLHSIIMLMITHNMYICTKTFCVRIRVCMYVVQNEKEKEIVILSYVYIHAEHTHQWSNIFNNIIMILLDVPATLNCGVAILSYNIFVN